MSSPTLHRFVLRACALLACATFIVSERATAQTFVKTRVVTDSLFIPWEILWGPDNWIWVTERAGRVTRVNPTTGFRSQILKLPNEFGPAEIGMLGMALHPIFSSSPFVYIVDGYERDTSIVERLVRYRYDPSTDTLVLDRVLLDSIPANLSHGGSRLMIGPDRTLYFTTGDTHDDPFSAPNRARIIGKTLRINLDGTVPRDNPWPDAPWPSSLVYTVGHRNSQGLAFGPDGTLYASEHGTENNDEVNLLLKGRSYGWPHVHGMCDDSPNRDEMQYCIDSNVVEPLYTFSPTVAPTGVSYYDHPLIDEFRGSLLMTTLGSVDSTPSRPTLSLIQLRLSRDGKGITEMKPWLSNAYGRLRDLCVSPDGRVFIATSNRDGRYWPGFLKYPTDFIVELTPVEDTAWVSTTATTDSLHLCMSDSIAVPFMAGGTFRSGNRFIVQLSNANGSFANPIEIGTLSPFGGQIDTIAGMIMSGIPDSIATGSGYRMRVAATRPYRIGNEFARGVTLHARPRPQILASEQLLRTDSVYASYSWHLDGKPVIGAHADSIAPRRSGSYSVLVIDSAGCSGVSSPLDVTVSGIETAVLPASSVRMYPSPARGTFTIEMSITKRGSVELVMTDLAGSRATIQRREAEVGTLRWEVDVTTIPPGAYIIELRTASGRWSQPLKVY